MARAVVVVADTGSQEVDELRRTVNTLLLMLETAAASITAGASAEDVLNAWSAAVTTGVDNNPGSIADVVSTHREVRGVKVLPPHPRRPLMKETSFDAADKDA